jgi:hypothetical protein
MPRYQLAVDIDVKGVFSDTHGLNSSMEDVL